jgi:hypothetical protein
MPAKLDHCVEAVLARKSFRPGMQPDQRKSAAYAICTASLKRNHDIAATLCQMPDDVDIELDENGNVRFHDVEQLMSDDVQAQECDEEAQYSIAFDEKAGQDGPHVFFAPCRVIMLADKKDDKEDDAKCAEPRVEIEMLREGTFKHPWYGDLVFNRKYFLSLIENFLNDVLDREISFDSIHAPQEGATGWLKELGLTRRVFKDKKRRYVLKGNVEPTEWGDQLIKGKRFKYYSIEVNDQFKDKETDQEHGPTIMGGGLTNRPFIPGMRSVKMSEDPAPVVKTEGEPAPGGENLSETPHTQEGVQDQKLLQQLDELMTAEDKNVSLAKEKQSRPPDSQLPNAAFALIKRDAAGKIVKRSLPHHGPNAKSGTENSSVDLGRLRNALARLNQTQGFSPAEIAAARRHLETHARALLKGRQTKASEGENNMDPKFQEAIDELQVKLDEMTDKNSEQAKAIASQIKTFEEAQAKFDAAMKANAEQLTKAFDQKLADQSAQLKTLAEQNLKNEQELAKTRIEKRQTEIKAFCDNLVADKHYPALVKVAKEVLLADVSTNSSWKLSEDGKDTTLSLQDFVTKLFAAIPAEGKVQTAVTLKQGGDDKPQGAPAPKTTIKLTDGTEAEPMSDEAMNKALKKTGFGGKNKNVQ